jgi:hypothetical protein
MKVRVCSVSVIVQLKLEKITCPDLRLYELLFLCGCGNSLLKFIQVVWVHDIYICMCVCVCVCARARVWIRDSIVAVMFRLRTGLVPVGE